MIMIDHFILSNTVPNAKVYEVLELFHYTLYLSSKSNGLGSIPKICSHHQLTSSGT